MNKLTVVAPDGKQDIVEGKEPLIKDPKKKKRLRDRWDDLKKALNNKTAIMDLEEASKEDEEDQQDGGEQPQPAPDQQGGDQQGEPVAPEIPEDGDEQPQED